MSVNLVKYVFVYMDYESVKAGYASGDMSFDKRPTGILLKVKSYQSRQRVLDAYMSTLHPGPMKKENANEYSYGSQACAKIVEFRIIDATAAETMKGAIGEPWVLDDLEERKKLYMEISGASCLYCGSDCVDMGRPDVCEGYIEIENTCRGCGRSWTEKYTLSSVDTPEDQEE